MVRSWEENPPRTLDDAVALAKALRCAADEGELTLMRYLRWLEDVPSLWQQSAEASYESFLDSVVGVKPRRYADARAALTAFGVETVAKMGIHGAIVATRVPEENRRAAVDKVLAIREANGVPASSQTTQQVLSNAHLLPPIEESRAQTRLSRVAEIERVNRDLRRQLADAEARASAAEARADVYLAQLRAAGLKPKDPSRRKVRAA